MNRELSYSKAQLQRLFFNLWYLWSHLRTDHVAPFSSYFLETQKTYYSIHQIKHKNVSRTSWLSKVQISFLLSRPDRNEYLNITRDSYFPALVYYSSWWGPFMGKKKKRREGDWLHCTTLHTYGSVNLNLRTKGSEFQFSCAAKDCLAFPDKLWVSVPPLLNKGLHSLWELPLSLFVSTLLAFPSCDMMNNVQSLGEG